MPKYRFEQIAINSTEKKKPTEEDRFTYLGLEHLDSGSLKVTRFGSDVAPIGEKLVMREGDVLFGKRRAYQKKVAIAPFDGIFSAHGMVLRPREDVIDKDFFPLFISSNYFLDAAIKISVGSLSPTINWRDLRNLEFNLPPLEEQRKLAKVLWAMNNTMEAYKKLIKATEELVKSQFIALFGDIERNDKRWPSYRLADKAEIGSSKRIFVKEYVPTGIPFYRSKEIIELGRGEQPSVELFISEARYQEIREKYGVPQKGDLLMTAVGTIGKFWTVNSDTPFYYKDGNLMCIRASSFNDVFFRFSLEMLIDQYKAKTVNVSAYAALPIEKMKEMQIVEPPLALQEQFASFVQQSDKSKLFTEAESNLTTVLLSCLHENLFLYPIWIILCLLHHHL